MNNLLKYLTISKENIIQNDRLYEETEQFQIVILTSSTNAKGESVDKASTVEKIEKICKQKKIKCYTVYSDKALIDKTENGNIYIKNINEKGLKIDQNNTAIIVRRGVVFHKHSLNLLSRLERMNFFTINQRATIEVCEDKY
jgi:hypothetical protein